MVTETARPLLRTRGLTRTFGGVAAVSGMSRTTVHSHSLMCCAVASNSAFRVAFDARSCRTIGWPMWTAKPRWSQMCFASTPHQMSP